MVVATGSSSFPVCQAPWTRTYVPMTTPVSALACLSFAKGSICDQAYFGCFRGAGRASRCRLTPHLAPTPVTDQTCRVIYQTSPVSPAKSPDNRIKALHSASVTPRPRPTCDARSTVLRVSMTAASRSEFRSAVAQRSRYVEMLLAARCRRAADPSIID
jgi:hypothetical protein